MKKKEVDDALFEGLRDVFVQAGFRPRKRDYCFVKKTPFGFQEVMLGLNGYHPHWRFFFVACIRFDAVQDVLAPLHAYCAPKLLARWWTVFFRARALTGQPFEFRIAGPDDIAAAVDAAGTLLSTKAFAVLDRCDSLAAVEHLLNRDPAYDRDGLLTKLAECGVAAAALCRRDDIEDVIEHYRHALAGHIAPARDQFEAAVAHIRTTVLGR